MSILHGKTAAFLILCVLLNKSYQTYAADGNSSLYHKENLEILSNTRAKAMDNAANNLNRFAMEKMLRYDLLLDSLYKSEIQDTLSGIHESYISRSAIRKANIVQLNKEITDLSGQRMAVDEQYSKLIKKALLAFLVWLVIVVFLLRYRKNKLRKVKDTLAVTMLQLDGIERSYTKAKELFRDFETEKIQAESVLDEIKKTSSLSEVVQSTTLSPAFNGNLEKASLALSAELNILKAVLSQSTPDNGDSQLTDLNSLCGQYLDMACRGLQEKGEIKCQVLRDFEKNLPPINMYPPAAGAMLFNIFINAFHSVIQKSAGEIKGYEPKITVSTRILPRFLQIRVRDNGTGMNDRLIENSFKEFFSAKTNGDGAGLGLFFAQSIMSDLHKGEIKIESEEGKSTDVYIKFYR